MMATTLVEARPRRPDRGIEVRPAAFQDDADAVMEGIVVASYRSICMAIRDPRVQRTHLKVLANLTEKLSYDTGTAWASRRLIAVEEGLANENVENACYDLRAWKYLHWERRASPGNYSGLKVNYTLRLVTVTAEQMRAEIESWCAKQRREIHRPRCTKSTPPKVDKGDEIHRLGCASEYTAQGRQMAQSTPSEVYKTPKSTPPAVTRNNREREDSSADLDVEKALALYNEAANEHRFAVCHKLSDTRRKRLKKRLLDIGGLGQFGLALSAIPKDDFLAGKVPPRNGQTPFRLDLDRLLSTDSGMGDVLAKLLDKALDTSVPPAAAPTSEAVLRMRAIAGGR